MCKKLLSTISSGQVYRSGLQSLVLRLLLNALQHGDCTISNRNLETSKGRHNAPTPTLEALILKIIIATSLLLSISCQKETTHPTGTPGPTVHDPTLQLELIAEQPTIKTPIGMTIDEQDALYILESHTHTPAKDYDGPKYDRIKKGIDRNGDGKPEEWSIFADSIEDGMNLAFDAQEGIFATTKNSVLLFKDLNGDGVSDQRLPLLQMVKPDYVYDHAGILGVACGKDGWLYVSRGNTGGRYWEVEGTDQSKISGYGDGGNVFRCKMDGSQVEEVATGFWNPFDIKFSAEGRLLLTDNDPDSRGPNRLIEVVPGGDYGYQSLYGGSGIHPFLSWNGELPGTLPYAAPLGEAPCALIDASFTNFGQDFHHQVLANIWEENNIVRIPLKTQGSSLAGEPEVLVQGDSLFHPVALVTNSKGDLYITDWVIRQYPNHGHGKIWRLRSKDNSSTRQAVSLRVTTTNRFTPLNSSNEDILEILSKGDAFEKTIARRQLAQSSDLPFLNQLIKSPEPELRLQGLLTFMERDEQLDKASLKALLGDADQRIRRMALIYTGRKMRQDMTAELDKALAAGNIGPELFDTYLAAVRHVQPVFIKALRDKTEKNSKDIPRELPDAFISDLLQNEKIDEANRAIALPYLPEHAQQEEMLRSLLKAAKTTPLQMALLQALSQSSGEALTSQLLALAQSTDYADQVRAKALQLLTLQSEQYCEVVQSLLVDEAPVVQYAAIKYLCLCTDNPSVRKEVNQWMEQEAPGRSTALQSSWNFCNGNRSERPESDETWTASVDGRGNALRGKLVFEALQTQCIVCHKVDGWGGTFGPDLSNVGSSKSSTQLINAILKPSLEIAPEWQGWYVTDQDGNTHYGRQIDVHLNHVELMNANGEFDRYDQPKAFGVAEQSLMTDGLENMMTKEEFNDLITYLETLQ